MSAISMDVPTFQISQDELQNLLSFIYKHERILKEFGAIKIRLHSECKLALKKRRNNIVLYPVTQQIANLSTAVPIYSVTKFDYVNESIRQNSSITDESSFWPLLFSSKTSQRLLNISLSPTKSFFSEKRSRAFFDIHRLPKTSLLKLCGKNLTRQFTPCVRRAHAPGAIFPIIMKVVLITGTLFQVVSEKPYEESVINKMFPVVLIMDNY
jgi:hypothetical protein